MLSFIIFKQSPRSATGISPCTPGTLSCMPLRPQSSASRPSPHPFSVCGIVCPQTQPRGSCQRGPPGTPPCRASHLWQPVFLPFEHEGFERNASLADSSFPLSSLRQQPRTPVEPKRNKTKIYTPVRNGNVPSATPAYRLLLQ